jgi:hypothetical protein
MTASPASERLRLQEEILRHGDAGIVELRSALQSAPVTACVAATALLELGETSAVRMVLLRCYDEEWLVAERGVSEPAGITAIMELPLEAVACAAEGALELAVLCHDPLKCRRELAVALSGLRVLASRSEPGFCQALWIHALNYGRTSLHGLASTSAHFFEWNYTDWIRDLAVEVVLTWNREMTFAALLEALAAPDHFVGHTAITGLRRLGDLRCIPYLERIVVSGGHPLALHARHAIERLAGAEAATLTLLRAAQEDEAPNELLRPMSSPQWSQASMQLVRSVFPPAARED